MKSIECQIDPFNIQMHLIGNRLYSLLLMLTKNDISYSLSLALVNRLLTNMLWRAQSAL